MNHSSRGVFLEKIALTKATDIQKISKKMTNLYVLISHFDKFSFTIMECFSKQDISISSKTYKYDIRNS